MKIAFQGVPGAYSELAARGLFGVRGKTVPCDAFEDVFNAVTVACIDFHEDALRHAELLLQA